jgi:hypothetical protein
VAVNDDPDLGYAEICAELSERFGTCFAVEAVGECAVIVAKFESSIELMVTDCGPTLSSVDRHLKGAADGFYVGVRRIASDLHRVLLDEITQLGYACDADAAPTAETIGDLIHQALEWARFLREEEKSRAETL